MIGLLVFRTNNILRLAMELFKTPAGLMATVFYRRSASRIISASSSTQGKDTEAQTSESVSPVRISTGSTEKEQISASPEEGRSLSWKDLHLTVDVAGEQKVLLDHLNGYIAPSSMTALMGVSGAGKVRS